VSYDFHVPRAALLLSVILVASACAIEPADEIDASTASAVEGDTPSLPSIALEEPSYEVRLRELELRIEELEDTIFCGRSLRVLPDAQLVEPAPDEPR
jgi:hypothetical protein